MTVPTDRRRYRYATAVAAAALFAVAATIVVARALGAFDDHAGREAGGRSCAVPALPGSVVQVSLVDMSAAMGRVTGRGGMMGPGDWHDFRHGMMRLVVAPSTVQHGPVSLRVTNSGYLTHELVVLPLALGARPGDRVPGTDGKVSEAGSLGEASASCGEGAGSGIAAGSTGWVTLTLPAGRYELACNLPGHYTAGMYAEFDVS